MFVASTSTKMNSNSLKVQTQMQIAYQYYYRKKYVNRQNTKPQELRKFTQRHTD